MNFSEKSIKGYNLTPLSIKEQALTKLAIQLSQNTKVKKDIIFQSKLLRLDKKRNSEMFLSITKFRLAGMCSKLPLPVALKALLIVRFQSVVRQLFSWNTQQAIFDISPVFADSLLTLSDWTVGGRLDVKTIAVRLVQDERISVHERYKIACFHCLESYIYSLWNQISFQQREDLSQYKEPSLVQLWSCQLAEEEEELVPNRVSFWNTLFLEALKTGSSSTVIYCWDKMHISVRTNMETVSSIRMSIEMYYMHVNQLLSSPYTDILYFLLPQLTEEQKFAFFQKYLQNTHHNILVYFLQWPYLGLLLPIIKQLWNILPVAKYGDLLLNLAHNYSDEADHSIREIGYVDYDYGDLIIDLLEESPDHFKRYLFSYNHQTDLNPFKILYLVIKKRTLNNRNIKIFKYVWQHVTLDEKRAFLRSKNGELFCCYLALKESWELLNSVVRESLQEKDIATFQDKILILKEGDRMPLF